MDRTLLVPAHVASIAGKDLPDAKRLVARVPAWVNAIEYRVDLAAEAIPPRALLEIDPRPTIVTYRTLREGGRFAGSPEEYARVVGEAYEAGAIVDVEHASGLLGEPSALPNRRRVIVSLHSPFSLPEDWRDRISAMRATGANAVKLVAGASHVEAGLRIGDLQRQYADGVVAIFPMGPTSAPGRVVSAHHAAALVYGSVEQETAPGQIPIRDLLEVYDVVRPRKFEALFGVIAGSTARSMSPRLHNALFRARDLPYLYLPLQVADFDREKPHEIEFDPPFRGFAVTQPWKLAAARTGRPSEDVRLIGASNTLVREAGSWRAENTDVDGVFDPLADHGTGEGRSAIVVGAGGAARAAVVAARRLGYEVAITARRDAEADRLAEGLHVDSLSWADLPASEADLYVNTTPVGWGDGEPSAIPMSLFEARPLVFDCVYRRDGRETSTMRAARAAKCPTVDGLQMFVVQAIRQAQLFGATGVTAEEVLGILRGGFAA
ncbi:MAG TPA: type I 3-dehydroquinate dehydratase [Thermoanaerobaculia bacterium]|jgi:shikimate dehydrogenase/3-dehydroquinate dehydratase type I|nr:type I 3-dehydroquinate dehydratase [Thermoanaerobaculia bacterium]